MPRYGVLFALAVLAFSCSETMEGEADMNRGLDRVFEQAALVDRELDAHATAVIVASDPAEVDDAERSHSEAMGPPMNALDHALEDMAMYCIHRHSEVRGRTHEMQTAMTAMRDTCERHRSAPRADLAAVRAEEERHLHESRAILTRLRHAASAMRPEAGKYHCTYGHR
jgi:hypothetical protein